MAVVDSNEYLRNGGFLQKDDVANKGPTELGHKEHYLAPSRWYRDQKIFDLERRSLFSTTWHVVSFTSRFQKAGDYVTCESMGWNFFLIRDKAGNINAFHNICRHRAYPVTQKECGSTTVLACKYHGWSYLPTGELHKAREYDKLPDFDKSDHSLFPIHTHVTSQGFIFVNFDARPTPATSFKDQFGDDFNPKPTSQSSVKIGDEFALFPQGSDDWVYDHTWSTKPMGTNFNWKTFVDSFQECYHCLTGHPITLPKNFFLDDFYIRQGHGMSRHYLPTQNPELGQPYITFLYPVGAIVFTPDTLFILRLTFAGPSNTWYASETYRKSSIVKPSPEHDLWMEDEIAYWRKVEIEDIELVQMAQKGYSAGVLGRGRLHSQQEHAIKWYQDKIGGILVEHAELEKKEGKNIDWSVPEAQREGALPIDDQGDKLFDPLWKTKPVMNNRFFQQTTEFPGLNSRISELIILRRHVAGWQDLPICTFSLEGGCEVQCNEGS